MICPLLSLIVILTANSVKKATGAFFNQLFRPYNFGGPAGCLAGAGSPRSLNIYAFLRKTITSDQTGMILPLSGRLLLYYNNI